MINQRLDAIQLELDKGEKADFSLFKPGVLPQDGVQLAIASKQVEEEESQIHHRSR
jgi:hypothetical protein